MQHSQVSPNARQQLAETVVLNKARLGLSWQDLADGTGLALTFVTAALLGQHALPEAAARKVAAQLGLDDDAAALRVSGIYPLDDSGVALALLEQSLPIRLDYHGPYWVSIASR